MQKCVKSWWPSSDEPHQLFFHVVGYMMFIFSYYSLLAADSNPLFLKRLGYFFYAGLQIRWSAKGSVFDRNSQNVFP